MGAVEVVRFRRGLLMKPSKKSSPKYPEENGRAVSKLSKNGGAVSERGELHLYHSNVSSLHNLHARDPKLTVLTLIGQPLRTLAGVENLVCLRELWAVECELQDASCVEKCIALEKLYLYSNHIREIPNLQWLLRLRVLWLSGNVISRVHHVDKAPALQELYLSKNRIHSLGDELPRCAALSTLNLSGNPLYLLMELTHLCAAAALRALQLGDPMYGNCPVVHLCNYRSFVVRQLPQIRVLDQLDVTGEERASVQVFYSSKFTYYSMMQHLLVNKHYLEEKEKYEEYVKCIETYRDHRIKYILKKLRCRNLEENAEAAVNLKLEHIMYKVTQADEEMKNWRLWHGDLLSVKRRQLELELQNAGNVRFTEMTAATSELMMVCQRLLDSYVCPHLSQRMGIRGARLLRVTQIHNKGLEILCNTAPWCKSRAPCTVMIQAPPHGLHKLSKWPFDVVESGFTGMDGFEVGVSNCLFYADQAWMKITTNLRHKPTRGVTLSVPSHVQSERRIAVILLFPRDTLLVKYHSNHQPTPLPEPDVGPSYRRCELGPVTSVRNESLKSMIGGAAASTEDRSARVCNNYFITSAHDVMPIAVMEYHYQFEDPLETFKQRMGWTADVHECRELGPSPRSPAHSVLDETTLPGVLDPGINLTSLTELTLEGCGIACIGRLPELPTVISLSLAYNRMASFAGLEAFPNVRQLDMSYNSLAHASSFEYPGVRKMLLALRMLNISSNRVVYLLEVLPALGKAIPTLFTLEVMYNPVEDLKSDMHQVFFARRHLPQLLQLNGRRIEEVLQCKQDTGFYCTKGGLSNGSLRRPEVTLDWIVDQELRRVDPKDAGAGIPPKCPPPYWASYRQLALTNVKVTDDLKLVKWADFSDNLLSDTEFLASCRDLEELSLSRNVLIEFPRPKRHSDTCHWAHLVRLDISRNYLRSMRALQAGCFPALKLLDVSGNLLPDLVGIEACRDLVECYAASNRIAQLSAGASRAGRLQEGLLVVKNCRLLRVLDVAGNPVERLHDFRRYCVFYVRKLEYLNGSCIQESDVTEAAHLYGGCLDREYLLKMHKAANLQLLRELSLSNSSLRKVNLPEGLLPSLTSLDLSYNSISQLWGLHTLPALHTLCLAFNQVSHMRSSAVPAPGVGLESPAGGGGGDPPAIFPALEVLYLNNNAMASAKNLHLNEMPQLRTLFLHNNELNSFDGLQQLPKLRHLVLDRNRIQTVTSEDCQELADLTDLYVEYNRLTTLFFAKSLRTLRRLFLAGNRVVDMGMIRHLAFLEKLQELTVHGNPVCRKSNFYQTVLLTLPMLSLIDGHSIELNNTGGNG